MSGFVTPPPGSPSSPPPSGPAGQPPPPSVRVAIQVGAPNWRAAAHQPGGVPVRLNFSSESAAYSERLPEPAAWDLDAAVEEARALHSDGRGDSKSFVCFLSDPHRGGCRHRERLQQRSVVRDQFQASGELCRRRWQHRSINDGVGSSGTLVALCIIHGRDRTDPEKRVNLRSQSMCPPWLL